MAVEKTVQLIGKDLGSAGVIASPQLRATINTTSNYTIPEGVKEVLFVLAGAGGGGSTRGNNNQGAGSGGGGGVWMTTLSTIPGSTISIAIGAGGTGALVANGDNNGLAGGSSTLTYSGLTYTANGGNRGGSPNSGFGYAGGGPGNISGPTSAGGLAFSANTKNNFIFEGSPSVKGTTGSYNHNTLYSGNTGYVPGGQGSGSGFPPLGLQGPYGTGTNLSNVTVSNYNQWQFNTGGQSSDSYTGWNQGQPKSDGITLHPLSAGGALVGGGGSASGNSNNQAGAGGAGHGGLGGSANIGISRAGGGGGGLTGPGVTATTTTGGTGGTGGGGGGGGGANGSGGNGGAGACLIYY